MLNCSERVCIEIAFLTTYVNLQVVIKFYLELLASIFVQFSQGLPKFSPRGCGKVIYCNELYGNLQHCAGK